jgi:hypothetical protein
MAHKVKMDIPTRELGKARLVEKDSCFTLSSLHGSS